MGILRTTIRSLVVLFALFCSSGSFSFFDICSGESRFSEVMPVLKDLDQKLPETSLLSVPVDKSDVFDYLDFTTYVEIRRLALHLLKSQQGHYFITIGRGLTAIDAFFQNLGGDILTNIPLSGEVRNFPQLSKNEKRTCSIAVHSCLERFLGPTFFNDKENLTILDDIGSGESLYQAQQFIIDYAKEQTDNQPKFNVLGLQHPLSQMDQFLFAAFDKLPHGRVKNFLFTQSRRLGFSDPLINYPLSLEGSPISSVDRILSHSQLRTLGRQIAHEYYDPVAQYERWSPMPDTCLPQDVPILNQRQPYVLFRSALKERMDQDTLVQQYLKGIPAKVRSMNQ